MSSNTQTLLKPAQTQLQHSEKEKTQTPPTLVIRLQHRPVPRVSWTQDTINNEHMNKKKSNLCCIYHRPGQSSSDTCTSDDEGNALQRDRHTKHSHKSVCSKRKNKQQKLAKNDDCCKGSSAQNNHNHNSKNDKKFLED